MIITEIFVVTFIKRNQSSSPSQGDGENSSGGSQVISMTADSYSVALRQLQTATDKFTTASHIKYYIVGEETLRDDFVHVTDAIARGYQTRLNSKIYLAKGMTAKAFLEKASKLESVIMDNVHLKGDYKFVEVRDENGELIIKNDDKYSIVVDKNTENIINVYYEWPYTLSIKKIVDEN